MIRIKLATIVASMGFATMSASSASAQVPVENLIRTSAVSESGPMDREKSCLAEAIYKEAGAESMKGRMAVANVILNRTRSGQFPRTLCGVVNQKGQFTFKRGTGIRRGEERLWAEARAVASFAMAGTLPEVVSTALYFRASRLKRVPSLRHVATIGGHVFYAGRR